MRHVVIVNDKMQQGYCYELSALAGHAELEHLLRGEVGPELRVEIAAAEDGDRRAGRGVVA